MKVADLERFYDAKLRPTDPDAKPTRTRDRAREAPHHPRRTHRRREARHAHPQRRARRTRAPVAIGYELTESKGKTANSRRGIDLDPTTADGGPVHPHSISQTYERVARNAGLPVIRVLDLRHPHATLLIKEGVPVKVVSERLGPATTAFTIETYQHVLPGMQADAANLFAGLIVPSTGEGRWKTRKKSARKR